MNCFQKKTVRISNKDKPFITKELKTLDRKKKKEWTKHGRSDKFLKLQKEFKTKYKKAAAEHLKKYVSDLKKENPGKAFRTLKAMGAQPGDCDSAQFTLGSHVRENLSVESQLERI